MSDETTLELKNLDKLIKALNVSAPSVRVGILGDHNAREGKNQSNATVGAYHEFGTSTLPIRSFLRVPLSDHLPIWLKKTGAFSKAELDEVLITKSLAPWLNKIGTLAVTVVQTAFETGGFGKWPPSEMKYKTNWQTLVETQQLRNSITYDVKGVA